MPGTYSFGKVCPGNCSTTELDADATFTGMWDVNDFEQVMVNVISDVPGTLYIDFGIPDLADGTGGITTTFTRTRAVYAESGYFSPLVKGAGRAFRVRYTNGSVAQTKFALLTSCGNNMVPASATDDNEILTTVTERERGVYVALVRQNVADTAYAILVDLSDTTNFPHDRNGRIDVTAVFLQADRDATAEGAVRLGIITRVDGTSADVAFVQGIRFNKSDTRTIIRDRIFSPNQLKLGVSGGQLTKSLGSVTTGITAINTATPLDSPRGSATVTPGVGDLVAMFESAAGTYNATASVFYHGEVAP